MNTLQNDLEKLQELARLANLEKDAPEFGDVSNPQTWVHLLLHHAELNGTSLCLPEVLKDEGGK